MFTDKFQYATADETLLFNNNFVQLVHTASKLAKLPVSLENVLAINNDYPVNDVHPETISAVLAIKHALQFILNKDHCLVFDDLLKINSLINNGDPQAGRLRDGAITVHLDQTDYHPAVPDEQTELAVNMIINDQKMSATAKAIELNLFLAKQQLFFKGNQRTALIVANDLMLHANAGMLLIPNDAVPEYQLQLSQYYLHDDDSLKKWLYDYAIYGE